MIANISEAKRIVVKVGTSTLAHKTGLMNIQRVERLGKGLATFWNSASSPLSTKTTPSLPKRSSSATTTPFLLSSAF